MDVPAGVLGVRVIRLQGNEEHTDTPEHQGRSDITEDLDDTAEHTRHHAVDIRTAVHCDLVEGTACENRKRSGHNCDSHRCHLSDAMAFGVLVPESET